MMRRWLLVVVAMFALAVSAQDAAPIVIDWSPEQTTISGMVEISGTVNPAGLQSYFFEVAPFDADEPRWLPVTLPATDPVANAVITTIDTTRLDDGVYRLRLHVRLQDGESVFYTLAPIGIANNGEVEVTGPVEVIETPPETLALAEPPAPTLIPPPEIDNQLPLEVGGHVVFFEETTQDYMRDSGMTWVKWQIPFFIGADLTPVRDRINWSHEAGFRVLLSVIGDVDELRELGEDYYPIYAEFLGQIAAMNPGAIEVWNEMNLEREWPRGRIDPVAYVEMLRQAYDSIKAADPNVIVITGALAPTGAEGAFGLDRVWNDDRYLQGMVNAGAADYSDCIGIHYNEGVIPPTLSGGDPREDYPTRYLPLMLERVGFPFRNADTALCFTEIGYLSPEGFDEPLSPAFGWAAGTTVEEQATWLAQAIEVAAAYERVPVRLFIVWNIDFERFDDDPQGGYAIVRPDGTCLACDTIGALRSQE